MSQTARYDKIGEGYSLTRREDPHIAQAIRERSVTRDRSSTSARERARTSRMTAT